MDADPTLRKASRNEYMKNYMREYRRQKKLVALGVIEAPFAGGAHAGTVLPLATRHDNGTGRGRGRGRRSQGGLSRSTATNGGSSLDSLCAQRKRRKTHPSDVSGGVPIGSGSSLARQVVPAALHLPPRGEQLSLLQARARGFSSFAGSHVGSVATTPMVAAGDSPGRAEKLQAIRNAMLPLSPSQILGAPPPPPPPPPQAAATQSPHKDSHTSAVAAASAAAASAGTSHHSSSAASAAANVLQVDTSSLYASNFQSDDPLSSYQHAYTLGQGQGGDHFSATASATTTSSAGLDSPHAQFLAVGDSSLYSPQPQPFNSELLDASMMDPGSPLASAVSSSSSDSLLGGSYISGYLSPGTSGSMSGGSGSGFGGGGSSGGFGYSPFDLFLEDDSNANAFMSALDSDDPLFGPLSLQPSQSYGGSDPHDFALLDDAVSLPADVTRADASSPWSHSLMFVSAKSPTSMLSLTRGISGESGRDSSAFSSLLPPPNANGGGSSGDSDISPMMAFDQIVDDFFAPDVDAPADDVDASAHVAAVADLASDEGDIAAESSSASSSLTPPPPPPLSDAEKQKRAAKEKDEKRRHAQRDRARQAKPGSRFTLSSSRAAALLAKHRESIDSNAPRPTSSAEKPSPGYPPKLPPPPPPPPPASLAEVAAAADRDGVAAAQGLPAALAAAPGNTSGVSQTRRKSRVGGDAKSNSLAQMLLRRHCEAMFIAAATSKRSRPSRKRADVARADVVPPRRRNVHNTAPEVPHVPVPGRTGGSALPVPPPPSRLRSPPRKLPSSESNGSTNGARRQLALPEPVADFIMHIRRVLPERATRRLYFRKYIEKRRARFKAGHTAAARISTRTKSSVLSPLVASDTSVPSSGGKSRALSEPPAEKHATVPAPSMTNVSRKPVSRVVTPHVVPATPLRSPRIPALPVAELALPPAPAPLVTTRCLLVPPVVRPKVVPAPPAAKPSSASDASGKASSTGAACGKASSTGGVCGEASSTGATCGNT